MNTENNEHLIDRIQILLLGFEGRIEKRFIALENKMSDGFGAANTRLDSIDRRLTLHAGALAHIVEWTNKYEEELIRMASELADVKQRLGKLENPAVIS
jgi:hypothetical protein